MISRALAAKATLPVRAGRDLRALTGFLVRVPSLRLMVMVIFSATCVLLFPVIG